MSPFTATCGQAGGTGPSIFTIDQLPPFDSVGGGSVFEIFADAHRMLFGRNNPTPATSRGAEGALFAPLLPPGSRNQNPPLVIGVLRRTGPECMFIDDPESQG